MVQVKSSLGIVSVKDSELWGVGGGSDGLLAESCWRWRWKGWRGVVLGTRKVVVKWR